MWFNKKESKQKEIQVKRKFKTKILAVGVESSYSYTLSTATIRNEKGKIETIRIENFDINEDVETLVGSFIEFTEDEQYEFGYSGTISAK